MKTIEKISELGGARIIEYIVLKDKHANTCNTEHYVGGTKIDRFYSLAICQYNPNEGFYLFYCDSNWNVVTDTWHENLEDAKDQALFEYQEINNDWIKRS